MKKAIFLLLSAALVLGSCTPSEPDLKKTEYLKLVHSTVGLTSSKADKTLTRKGFVESNQSITQSGIEALLCDKTYSFQSKDSSTVLHVGLVLKNDSVKQYILSAQLKGEKHKNDVQKLYTEWSNYAYNTIFSDIALWSANWFAEDNLGNFGDIYLDGAWASMLKNMMMLYHETGGMSDEVYEIIMAAFNHKRGDWEATMASINFLQEEGDLYESFAHGTGEMDLAAIMTGDLSSLKGTFGTSTTRIDIKDGVINWEIVFLYLNEQDLSKIMEDLPL